MLYEKSITSKDPKFTVRLTSAIFTNVGGPLRVTIILLREEVCNRFPFGIDSLNFHVAAEHQ